MKKLLSVLLLGAMLVGTLASCDSGEGSDTTVATTTQAPTTTTKQQVAQTTPPEVEFTTDPSQVAETPMELAEVETWMAEHTMVNDLVDRNTLFASQVGFFADGGMPNLFDDIYTKDEWDNAIAEGLFDANTHEDWVDTNGDGVVGLNEETGATDKWIALGKMGFSGSTCTIFWSMTEQVTLGSYVIYTGNDNSTNPNRNPVGWKIYATNDAALAAVPEDTVPYAGTSAMALKDKESLEAAGWVCLDDVFDGAMADADFTPFGYKIDEDKQAAYQYYCWFIDYGGDATSLIQVNGLKLYAA